MNKVVQFAIQKNYSVAFVNSTPTLDHPTEDLECTEHTTVVEILRVFSTAMHENKIPLLKGIQNLDMEAIQCLYKFLRLQLVSIFCTTDESIHEPGRTCLSSMFLFVA